MSDRLDELDVLIAVVEAGSLRAAALRLRRSPAAVTRAIAALEDRLQRRLLDRTTRRLAVTEAGRAAYEAGLGMSEAWRSLASVPPDQPVRGLVRITAPVMLGQLYVAPALDAFLSKWPEATGELLLDDLHLDFIEYGLDAAVRLGHLADSSLKAQRVGGVRWVTVASPAYLSERGVPAAPSDLAGHATITESARSGRPSWTYAPRAAAGGRGETIALAPRLMSNDIQVQLGAARAGRGIARVLTYHAAADLASGTLVRILRDREPDDIPVQVVTSGGRYADQRSRAIADHLVASLRGAVPALPR